MCQIAFLRRAYKVQNETLSRRFLPWLRVKPSSPVAESPIVIMASGMSKAEMDQRLLDGLAQRGVDPSRTMVGWDVVCRVGDPADVHDLVRVRAHEATSIVVMVTDEDTKELEESQGDIENGHTIRTILALRRVMVGSASSQEGLGRDLRIVIQMYGHLRAIWIACRPADAKYPPQHTHTHVRARTSTKTHIANDNNPSLVLGRSTVRSSNLRRFEVRWDSRSCIRWISLSFSILCCSAAPCVLASQPCC